MKIVKKVFTGTEKRVIRAMYRLNRFATANEISQWADGMSWNTAKLILMRLYKRKVVAVKTFNGRKYWTIKRF